MNGETTVETAHQDKALWTAVSEKRAQVLMTTHRNETWHVTHISPQGDGLYMVGGIGFAFRHVSGSYRLTVEQQGSR